MPKPRKKPSPTRSGPALPDLLKSLVLPAFRDPGLTDEEAAARHDLDESNPDFPVIRGLLRGRHLVNADLSAEDEEHFIFRLTLYSGHLISHEPGEFLFVGHMVEPTPFHVRLDNHVGFSRRLTIGCDLVVRRDDGAFAQRRMGELLDLGDNLEWFFPLRMPQRLAWQEITGLEFDWEELTSLDLEEFLEQGMEIPPPERTPLAQLRVAQGLERWEDMIRLLDEHPDVLPPEHYAPLRCMAHGKLGQWQSAIRAARNGGLRRGRYDGAPWLSPNYLLAMIGARKITETLRLLGKPKPVEPGFYDWFRGVAFHHAGSIDQAQQAFERYFSAWPGDMLGLAEVHELENES